VVFLPIVLVLVLTMRAHAADLCARAQPGATARLAGALGDLFASIQAVQVAGAEKSMLQHVYALSHERQLPRCATNCWGCRWTRCSPTSPTWEPG